MLNCSQGRNSLGDRGDSSPLFFVGFQKFQKKRLNGTFNNFLDKPSRMLDMASQCNVGYVLCSKYQYKIMI